MDDVERLKAKLAYEFDLYVMNGGYVPEAEYAMIWANGYSSALSCVEGRLFDDLRAV
jgi:hypothetical protein